MAPRPRYERGFSFAAFQANQPKKSLPGQRVDIELDEIADRLSRAGASAYELATLYGFSGTEADYLASLVSKVPGPPGPAVDGLTAADLPTYPVPAPLMYYRTSGFAAAGDGGDTLYKRGNGPSIGTITDSTGAKFTMADGTKAPAKAFGCGRGQDDGPLIQAILNAYGVLNAGPGFFTIRTTVKTGAVPVTINGVGDGPTIFVTDTAGDMFEHGFTVPVPSGGASFVIRDCRLARAGGVRNATTNKIPGTAVRVKQVAGPGEVVVDNVLIDSFSSDSCWERAVYVEGPAQLVQFNRMRVSAGAFETTTAVLDKGTDVGVHIVSTGNDALVYQVTFKDCVLEGIYHGLLIELTGAVGNTGSCEGVSLLDCGGRTVRGAWIKQRITVRKSDGGLQDWCPPGLWMERCNFQGTYAMLDWDSGSEIHLKDNFHYIEGAVDRPHSIIPHMVRFGRAVHCHIHGNSFYTFKQRPFFGNPGNYPVQLQSLIAVETGHEVNIYKNRITVENHPNVQLGYGILLGAPGVLDRVACSDNFFDGGGSTGEIAWPWGDAKRVFNGQAALFTEGFDTPALTLVQNPGDQMTSLALRNSVGGVSIISPVKLAPADGSGRCMLYIEGTR